MQTKDTCEVVAEVSANHLGSFERACDIVRASAATGVDYIKFQTYTPDTMTLDLSSPDFFVSTDHSLWGGRTLYSLYEEAHTPWEWHSDLFDLARSLGVTPFSTPFDPSAVDFLEDLEAPMYKIASLEIVDTPLIRYAAETGKPLIISTGTATLTEIDDAVEAARAGGCSDLTLLLCTSSYPALPSDVHLRRMATLQTRYCAKVGLSDHTVHLGTSIAAVSLGASILERHVTLLRSDGGPDAAFSLEPPELALLVREVRAASESLGSPKWLRVDSENESRRIRRSLYVVKDVQQGEVVTSENVRAIRPGFGMAPKYWDALRGQRFTCDVPKGTPMTRDLVKLRSSETPEAV